MNIRRSALAWGVVVFTLIGLVGCQDEPGIDAAVAPEESQQMGVGDVVPAMDNVQTMSNYQQGSVYTLSNATTGNSVLEFTVSGGGTLKAGGVYPTGGTGTGAGLGSQAALVKQGDMLYAVNAGSNSVSVLRIRHNGMSVVSTVPSGGMSPISLTVKGDILYVLNGGGGGNISGFRGASSGNLHPIPGSSLPLSGAGTAPAQIQFSPNGRFIVVTEKGTNKILTYTVAMNGSAHGPIVTNSTGDTPFGFDFTPRGQLVISDAYGGSPLQSALSSYGISRKGAVSLITGPVVDMQTAACWVVVSEDGRFAYTTNNGSNNISGYRVAHDGTVTLFADGGNTASTDAGPIDMALSHTSATLFCLNAKGNTITSYHRNLLSGSLAQQGSVGGLPSGAAGLVAE